MATILPAALKSADVQRFATRAAQLEKYKPIATYWLEYYVLQQILSRQLHATSPEVGEYAVQLMDKVEAVKTQYAGEAAITDDTVAKAYMEEFAGDTFKRAEDAQSSDKVTRQTADTFQAAATFYDSLSIWGELDPESKAKSKFAKFHALRIARALKEGKDPNESNPKVEVPPAAAEDDELEAELKKLAAGPSAQNTVSAEAYGTETVPIASSTAEPETSPVDPSVNASDRPVSIGGGYFPSVPSVDATLPAAVPLSVISGPHIDEEDHVPTREAPEMLSSQIDSDSHIPPQHMPVQTQPQPSPTQFYASAPQSVQSSGVYKTDDDAVMAAQKHAKWAISALNFEDVPTAVKELRIALQALGGL